MKCVHEWLNGLIMCLIRVWNCLCVKLSVGCFWASLHVKNRWEVLVISPRRAALAWAKIPEVHLCHCAKSRLDELESPERENFSSRRASLAWARVRSGFLICHCMRSRSGESSSPKRENSLAQARPSSLSEIPCRNWLLYCFWLIDVVLLALI